MHSQNKAYMGTKPYIFVSYSRKDSRIVYPLIEQLQGVGYRIWYDTGISKGSKWANVIKDKLRHCSIFLIFMSQNSNISLEVKRELIAAEFQYKKLVPVFLDNLNPQNISKEFAILKSLNAIEIRDFQIDLNELSDAIGRKTRDSEILRDVELIRLGFLPTIADFKSCEHNLTEKTKHNRLNKIVASYTGEDAQEYKIDNVFQLTSSESQAIFNLSEKNIDWMYRPEPVNLLSKTLVIEKSFVSPLRLLSSLASSYDDNWPPIVEAYSRLASLNDDSLTAQHYFSEFCWLSWGPSVETKFLLNDANCNFMVAQVSIGDEANSIPLILEKETWCNYFISNDKSLSESDIGWPMKLRGLKIVNSEKDPYFSELRNIPFFKNFFQSNPVALYLSKTQQSASASLEINASTRYYSTAYLWLILEQVDSTGKPDEEMKPGRVLPFFEHANLAFNESTRFLQECLARKAIYHVLNCAQGNSLFTHGIDGVKTVRYQYSTALFDEYMVSILRNEISKLKPYESMLVNEFLIIPECKDRRTATDVCRFADKLLHVVRESLPE